MPERRVLSPRGEHVLPEHRLQQAAGQLVQVLVLGIDVTPATKGPGPAIGT
jgi:hypothetical protein